MVGFKSANMLFVFYLSHLCFLFLFLFSLVSFWIEKKKIFLVFYFISIIDVFAYTYSVVLF